MPFSSKWLLSKLPAFTSIIMAFRFWGFFRSTCLSIVLCVERGEERKCFYRSLLLFQLLAFLHKYSTKKDGEKSDLISLLLNTWTLYIHLFRLCARWWYLHKLIPKINCSGSFSLSIYWMSCYLKFYYYFIHRFCQYNFFFHSLNVLLFTLLSAFSCMYIRVNWKNFDKMPPMFILYRSWFQSDKLI